MTNKESVVRLLLVEDQIEDAEQITSILRNGGMAVRPQRAESAEQLESVLGGSQHIDIVIADIGAKYLPFDRVAELVVASGKDVSLLALAPQYDDELILLAYRAGASRLAPRNRPEIVQAVVRAEFAALENRRDVRRLQTWLRETERRCDSLIDSSRDPIAYIHEGMHIRANQAYLEMFGYEEFEEVEGLSVLDMITGAHADSFKQLLKRLSKGEPPPKTLQVTAQRSDGSSFDAVMEFAQATYEGEPCLQIVFRQQSIDAEVVKELDALRSRDQLTGLYNRQHFMAELDETIAAAAEGRKDQALLLMEIDNYGNLLNDIGLGNADDLLAATARRLEEVVGTDFLSARFGDHTFSMLMKDSAYHLTRDLGERILAAFQGRILEVGERSLSITVSIGGVQIGEKIASIQQVLAKAGQCLQGGSGLGGNRLEIYDPAARDRAEEERVMARVKQVEDALQHNRFVLHYQPVISLHGDGAEFYEVLIRLQMPNGDLVPPASFLPEAEEHGLLGRIDRWVLGRAIALLAERQKAGRDTTLFVNISTQSLLDERLPGLIGQQLKKTGLEGRRLALEIPESKVFTNLKPAQLFQAGIAAHGLGFSLEQFGSGLNSFQLLSHVDAQYLRIDRSFMADLAKNAENQKKIREIADRARDLGKKTIAEFVQDAASMTVLFTSSVDFVCGNFLAPAGPEMNYDFG
jgi:multidomain signaling protein FimX